jgi:hypothetical protein
VGEKTLSGEGNKKHSFPIDFGIFFALKFNVNNNIKIFIGRYK